MRRFPCNESPRSGVADKKHMDKGKERFPALFAFHPGGPLMRFEFPAAAPFRSSARAQGAAGTAQARCLRRRECRFSDTSWFASGAIFTHYTGGRRRCQPRFGQKISPPAKRPSTRLSRSSVDERRRARGFPAGISAAGRRTDRRSRYIGMKRICAAPYESVLKLCSVEGQATYSPYRVSAFCRPLGRPPCAFLSAIPLRSGTHKRVTVFAVLVLWPAGRRLCGKILKNVVANLRALCYDRKAINAKVFYAARRRGGADGPARCCSCRRR